jgi:hypothetical protein
MEYYSISEAAIRTRRVASLWLSIPRIPIFPLRATTLGLVHRFTISPIPVFSSLVYSQVRPTGFAVHVSVPFSFFILVFAGHVTEIALYEINLVLVVPIENFFNKKSHARSYVLSHPWPTVQM